jgi:AAA+ superfamily predicted ATPase
MSTAEAGGSWSEANQRYLVAELARLKARLGAAHEGDGAASVVAESRKLLPRPAAIDVVTELFGLSGFERDVLLLAAGVELDAELARACAQAQGSAQCAHATFALALGALEGGHWNALAPIAPLRRWQLLEIDDGPGITTGRLRIDERILHYLAGVNYLDPRLQALLRLVHAPQTLPAQHREIAASILEALGSARLPAPPITLCGDDAEGQCDVAAHVAAQLGLGLYAARVHELPAGTSELDALALLWQREAALLGGALLLESRDGENIKSAGTLIERIGGVLFISGREQLSTVRPALHYRVNRPGVLEQKKLWQEALGDAAQGLNGSIDGVAGQFLFSAQTIRAAGSALRGLLSRCDGDAGMLWRTCRRIARARLDELAQRIEAAAGWDDLILPDDAKSLLRQLAVQAKHRIKVYYQWGFADKNSRGLGIAVLFAGESGTGKTMAAEVLANELHLDLYRIDLASIVSKYIGETEKNLRRVFDAAEQSGAILLFDEADALFGKRSDVKDSHDRYANIEISYLLQRMETYRGLAILTSNLRHSIDPAFQRRLRFLIQFPFPDATQREQIWRRVFPSHMPIDGVDYGKLARLQVAGGNIRNIALSAAFCAAEAGERLTMSHLLHAAHHEAAKRERPLSDAETRGWV